MNKGWIWALGVAALWPGLTGCAGTWNGAEVIDGKMRFVVVEASGGG